MIDIFYPEYFKVHELVHPYYWEKYGEDALRFCDPLMVHDSDLIRKITGRKVTCNDYFWGGKRINSGRRCWHQPYKKSAPDSTHYDGKGFDWIVEGMRPTEVSDMIVKEHRFFKGITRIEDPKYTPGWTHGDSKPSITKNIYIFQP